jgi:predicted RNase H-like nuclease (RuvC/YqgF family)
MVNELISEKDAAIGNLNSELQLSKSDNEVIVNLNETIRTLQNKNTALQDDNNGLNSKVSHMDTLLKQITQMKTDILAKNAEIEELTEKLNPKKKIKIINTKKAEIVEKLPAKTKFEDQGLVDKTVALLPVGQAVQL